MLAIDVPMRLSDVHACSPHLQYVEVMGGGAHREWGFQSLTFRCACSGHQKSQQDETCLTQTDESPSTVIPSLDCQGAGNNVVIRRTPDSHVEFIAVGLAQPGRISELVWSPGKVAGTRATLEMLLPQTEEDLPPSLYDTQKSEVNSPTHPKPKKDSCCQVFGKSF